MNLYEDIPDRLTEEQVKILYQQPYCRIERIVSCGQTTPVNTWYDQQEEEWVVLLQGEATLSIEKGGAGTGAENMADKVKDKTEGKKDNGLSGKTEVETDSSVTYKTVEKTDGSEPDKSNEKADHGTVGNIGAAGNIGECEIVQLKKGDLLILKKHQKHRITYTSQDPPCIWLCFFIS